jgi:transcription initiation factor TFIID subunit 2
MNISNTKASLQDRVYELVKPFRDLKTIWQVRIEANRALLDLEFHSKGIDAALLLFTKYVEEEPSLRGCESFPERIYMMFGNLENGL